MKATDGSFFSFLSRFMDGRRWGTSASQLSCEGQERHFPVFLLVHFGFSHALDETRRGASLSLLPR